MFVADLREVGAPCWVLGPARPEKRLGVGEQLLGGTVGLLRHRSHHHLLGRPPVRTLLTAHDQLHDHLLCPVSHSHIQMMKLTVPVNG